MSKATENRLAGRGFIALVLLIGMLAIAGTARTSAFRAPANLTQRILRLNRIGEPSTEQLGTSAIVAVPLMGSIHRSPAAARPAMMESDAPRPSSTIGTSPAQLRSPPYLV